MCDFIAKFNKIEHLKVLFSYNMKFLLFYVLKKKKTNAAAIKFKFRHPKDVRFFLSHIETLNEFIMSCSLINLMETRIIQINERLLQKVPQCFTQHTGCVFFLPHTLFTYSQHHKKM